MIQLNELAAALVDFQAAVPVIPKNKTASISTRSGGSYSYSYADLADIWEVIRKPLKDHGLAVTQALCGGSDGWLGIQTTVWHKSGQSFGETVEVPVDDRTAQEVGSQITYFKRYALAAILGISTEEDDDGKVASTRKPPAKKPTKSAAKPTLEQVKADLRSEIKRVEAESGQRISDQYFWVKNATDDDIPRILGMVEALKLGKVVAAT